MRVFKALLIWHQYHAGVGTIRESIDAIKSCKNLTVDDIDFADMEKSDIESYDVIIFHYSVVIAYSSYFSDSIRARVGNHPGLKVLFIQDEYRFIDRTARAIYEMGITVVFSLVNPNAVRKVYHHPWLDHVRFEHTLTGYVPEELCARPVPNYEDRPIDISYRARKLASWMGTHTIQKWKIAESFPRDAAGYGLTFDISVREEDRLYGEDWINLIANSKAVLGTESGASVCDFSGELQAVVEAYASKNPDADPEDLHNKFVRHLDGVVVMNVISPRCFEAIALRTLLIMYEGEYSGVLEPHRHYLVLNKDHSNLDEVVKVLRTPSLAQAIIDTAFQEIAMSERWRYGHLTRHLSMVIEEEYTKRPWPAPAVRVPEKHAVTGSAVSDQAVSTGLDSMPAQSAETMPGSRVSVLRSLARLEKGVLTLLRDALRNQRMPAIVRIALYPFVRVYVLARYAAHGAYLAVKNAPPI